MSDAESRFLKLVSVIEELAAGQLDARYPISQSRDETDAIGFGINTLAEELSITIQQLEREAARHRGTAADLLEAERSRDRFNEELEQLQTARLASLGMLAAGIGHEVNNPLTYVIGNLDFLRQRLLESSPNRQVDVEEVRELIDESYEGAERIRTIVRDLGVFSRVSEDVPNERVDVRRVVDQALAAVHNETRHRAQLIVEYRAEPVIATSRSRLLQVLVNLLINAVHSFGSHPMSENEIRVSVSDGDGGGARVEISDTGRGIPEEDLSRVFDPFFTTKSRGEGSGLGLSICRELMLKMRGELSVLSEVGKGTTFVLALPSTYAQPHIIEPTNPVPPSNAKRATRTLIIDDEPAVARSLARKLDGAENVIVDSGRKALDVLALDSDFDFVFCDLMMPGMSGMDVYEAARARSVSLASRFVFTTAGAYTERAKRFLESISNPCISKPYDGEVLSRLVAR